MQGQPSYRSSGYIITSAAVIETMLISSQPQGQFSVNGEHHHWLQPTALAKIALKMPLLVRIVHWWPTPEGVGRVS